MMKFKYHSLYLFALLASLLVSCSEEIIEGEGDMPEGAFHGTLMLNVSAGEADISTRSLNMNDGATVKINSLWVGIFDRQTGKRIGRTRIEDFNRTVSTGSVSKNVISVDFFSDYSNPEVFVVGVANFEDVTTWDKIPVVEAIEKALTWEELVAVDVDAESAYAGNKGMNSFSQEPFLMGFYLEATGLSRVPKFNQLDPGDDGRIMVYPDNAEKAMTIKLIADDKGEIYVPAGALTLRRLVSNVNVNLVPGDGIEISDVSYMVFNQPKTVFLVQRRTDTDFGRSFSEWQRLSPNRADFMVSEDGDFNGGNSYFDDEYWRSDLFADGLGFSFQHFENKHWGAGDIKSFSDREKKNSDGTLAALSPGGGRPYNNHASFFKIKMHVTDNNKGRNGEVVYTIHEGLCNTDDGRKAEDDATRMKDYGSFRNNNYTYTVNVNGVDKIVVNASLDETDEDYFHGQEGKIWSLEYANGDARQIPDSGGAYGSVRFTVGAIPGFRLFGYDSSGETIDICYNFPSNGAKLLGGFWPELSDATVFTNRVSELNNLPVEFLNEILISDGVSDYSLQDFIKNFDTLVASAPASGFKFKFASYTGPWEDDPRENMRALYLFDCNEFYENPAGTSSYGKVYIAEQYPRDIRPEIGFDSKSVLWHTALHTTSESKWCGCTNSEVELVWVHDPSFEAYFVETMGVKKKISKEMLPKYLKTVSGKQAIVFPFATDRISGSENPYDVIITPVPKDKTYKGGATVVSKALAVYPSQWNMKTTPLWKDLNVSGKTLIDVEYRGLELYQNNSTANASVKGSYLSFGGSANLTNRIIRFYTVKSGKLTVTACSNAGLPSGAASSSIDTSRFLLASLVKFDEEGNQVVLQTISKEDEHVPYNNRTADFNFDISIGEPCYVYLTMSGGNIRVYGITFQAY